VKVVSFIPSHAHALELQKAQEHERSQFKPEHLLFLANQDTSFTVLEDDKPVACFGWLELYPTRALIWTVLGKGSEGRMLSFTRIAKRMLAALLYARVEAEVDADFQEAQRWMEMLGLRRETPQPLRCYNAHGKDVYIYARVK
jgi:RimJ/RimL family protein N-acetyltransferase